MSWAMTQRLFYIMFEKYRISVHYKYDKLNNKYILYLKISNNKTFRNI